LTVSSTDSIYSLHNITKKLLISFDIVKVKLKMKRIGFEAYLFSIKFVSDTSKKEL